MTQMTPFDIKSLFDLQQKPPVFTRGEEHFWTDPHIARQMLKFHLDPNEEAASRRPETIDRTVSWIMQALGLQPGERVLDMGCGPGLYTARFTQKGLQVTGVDFSQNSIDYAVEYALQHGLDIAYRCQNYLQLDDDSQFDAILLIYGDFCPLSPQQRVRLLANVRRALTPGGRFVLDVTTPRARQRAGLKNHWYISQGGFWKPGPHLVLEQGFAYNDDIYLDQYIVVENDGKVSVYRNWFQDFTAEKIRAELEVNDFIVESLWGDLTGAPYQEESDWIGIIARRR